MERLPDSSLIIGVATSTAERVHLARLLGGADALLLVSSAEQARAFLELTSTADSAPVVLTPAVVPALGARGVTAQIEAALPTSEPAAYERPIAPTSLAVAAVPAPPAAGLRLDVDRRVVRWKDREARLTKLEHDFLHCLVEEPGKVWTYQRLHHAVWGNEHLGHGSHIHSVVKRLRQKLASLGATVTIHAVRGVGFHLLAAT
ncbi:winged helix-turn-helix domain-containing protein [Streptomyces sp. SID13031]|uniref:winged helix-turn-helix domain-containing protein n=1 Tax=Streptomyces sp. SID13031 TaxID=2706046 RepID=UPI0013C85381|nr:winged helix-turn-helix domain-containing protein [Streptomyces sp. SID13031]NEA34771.1 winged helix-turn-helix transcriptional regulator [Streptomyces sp. SID13031]